MMCGGLVAGGLWLSDRASAQEPFPPTSGAAAPSTPAPDVARRRVQDYLSQAQQAWRAGHRDQATRLALAADQLAREAGLTFGPNEPSPGALLAEMQGLAPANPRPAAAAPVNLSAEGADATQHHRHVQNLLQAAESDLRAGRHDEALDKAHRAELYAARNGVKFGPVDLRPEHIVSLVRRQNPAAAVPSTPSAPVAQAPRAPVQPQASSAPAPAQPGAPTQDPAALKQHVQELLAAAKHELQQQNFAEARSLALEARQYDGQVAYSIFDDRPDHILAEIERRTQTTILAASPPARPVDPNDSRRQQAVTMLREAEAHLQAGRLDIAEHLARQAQQMGVAYDVTDPRPEVVLQDIHHHRIAMSRQPGGSSGGGIQQTGGTLDAASGSPSEAKAQATALLQAARQAMQESQWDLAIEYAQAASEFDVTYGLLEDRPDRVMADIVRLTQQDVRQAGGTLPVRTPDGLGSEKQRARELLARAEQALAQGDLNAARRLALEADQLDVAYDLLEVRPDALLAEIERIAAGGAPLPARSAPVAAAPRRDSLVIPPGATADELYQLGLSALRSGNREGAREAFLAAHHSGQPLDPVRRKRLQDYLAELSAPGDVQTAGSQQTLDLNAAAQNPLLTTSTQRREIRSDRLRTQVLEAIYQAEKLREKQPEQALELLHKTSAEVNAAEINEQEKSRLLASLESTAASLETYLQQRKPLIELERRNAEVRNQIRVERETKLRIEQELAALVDKYNQLMEQRQFAAANHVARQAQELDPKNPVVVQMYWQSTFAARNADNEDLKRRKEETFIGVLRDVEWAPVHNIRDNHPIDYPKDWKSIIERRQAQPTDLDAHTEEELRVRESLDKPVSLHFEDEPLGSIMRHIADTFLINVTVDDKGLLETGITPSTPITINVDGIRLKSALNLILTPLDLSYTVDNETLMITSRLRQQGDLKPKVYPVADLVVPIPVNSPVMQFVPMTGTSPNSLPTVGNMPNGGGFGQVPDPLASQFPGLLGEASKKVLPDSNKGVVNYDFQSLTQLITSVVEPDSWAEFGGQATITQHENTLSLVIRQTQRVHQEIADLLSQLRRLQDLQVSIEVRFITVSDRFFERIGIDFDFNVQDTVGGPIANNDFSPLPAFGVPDSNFGSRGATTQQQGQGQGGQQAQGGSQANAPFGPTPLINLQGRDSWPGRTVVGMIGENTFSPDLDIPFRQGSFGLSAPSFGGFQADAGISFGLAILSDIEAFLFVNAAQGDTRSNIMFAPKITLFNGMFGNITSGLLRPFVVSVVPVATGLVVGFQPIITTILDGVSLTVQAVISADRRYVRLSVAPFFQNVTDVFTFSFIGAGAAGGGAGGGVGGGLGAIGVGGGVGGGLGGGVGGIGGIGGQQQQGQQGAAAAAITVQQPVTDTVTVSTVVSVPDGGTVLLGGVKRLREQRLMAGVPILNKIPYISRLFKNTGVGRETDSLMLMVTPRIIIAEEEEELLGIPTP